MGQANEGLKPEVIEDLTDNTRFTEDEIRQWYDEFIKDCPDQHITVKQFKEIYTNLFPDGDPGKFAQHVFRTFDSNGDGKIDFREFVCAMSVNIRGTVSQKLKWAFNTFDANRNGKITKGEMLEIVTAIYKMVGTSVTLDPDEDTPEKRVEKVFAAQDKNADDCLDLNEFVEGARRDPSIIKLLQASSRK